MVKERVVLIDDDPDFLEVCVRRLEASGYEVRSFQNANDAVRAIRHQKPDVVISDIKMPGLNGFEVCDLLKSDRYTKQIPIILITGHQGAKPYMDSLGIKPMFFIMKPFGSQDLLSTIRAALDSSVDLDEPQVHHQI